MAYGRLRKAIAVTANAKSSNHALQPSRFAYG
jgi:hypothetical protein